MTNPKTAKLAFLSAILIYSTLGVFVRYAGQPSALVALAARSFSSFCSPSSGRRSTSPPSGATGVRC